MRLKFRRFLGSRVRSWRRYLNEVATVGPDDDYAKSVLSTSAVAPR